MAERRRIIEGTWACTSCDAKDIPGREKKCPSCGNPRELTGKESQFDFGEVNASGGFERAAVGDEKALEAARAGVDWFCEFCGASNRGDGERCRQCSAERSKTAKVLSEGSVEAKRGGAAKAALETMGAAAAATAAAAAAADRARAARKLRRLTMVGALLAGGAGLVMWGLRQVDVPGRVTLRSWERTVNVERFEPVAKQDWRDRIPGERPVMPVNGAGERAGAENVRDCERRQRSTRKVQTGTERVCRNVTHRVQCGTESKCTRKDLGNGFAEEVCNDVPKYCDERAEECKDEPKYRDEPVYGEWCTYSTFEWKSLKRLREAGEEEAPRWPVATAGERERLVREERYHVVLSYQRGGKAEQHVLQPAGDEEFARWKLGQEARLTVNNFGTVKNVAPPAR